MTVNRKFISLICVALLALFLLSHSANADWSDDFDGGLQQAWTFHSISGGNATSSPTFSGSSDVNRLRLNDTTAGVNNGAAYGFGVVETELFTDVEVGGVVNPGRNVFVSQTHMLIARTNLADSTYYAAGIDLQLGNLMIYRSDGPGMTTTLSSTSVNSLSFVDDYYIDFVLESDQLTTTVYESEGGNEIETITAVDAVLSEGHSGVVGQSASGERILSIWDNVSSVSLVPEPSSSGMAAIAFCSLAIVSSVRRRRGGIEGIAE